MDSAELNIFKIDSYAFALCIIQICLDLPYLFSESNKNDENKHNSRVDFMLQRLKETF